MQNELYQLVDVFNAYLSYADLKQLRLVCKAFEPLNGQPFNEYSVEWRESLTISDNSRSQLEYVLSNMLGDFDRRLVEPILLKLCGDNKYFRFLVTDHGLKEDIIEEYIARCEEFGWWLLNHRVDPMFTFGYSPYDGFVFTCKVNNPKCNIVQILMTNPMDIRSMWHNNGYTVDIDLDFLLDNPCLIYSPSYLIEQTIRSVIRDNLDNIMDACVFMRCPEDFRKFVTCSEEEWEDEMYGNDDDEDGEDGEDVGF